MASEAPTVSDVRVFLSFDVDHDEDLRELLLEQSRRGGSGFLVTARSEAGMVTESWCEAARRRIRDVEQVIVICGEHTEDSLRMSSELRIAQEEKTPFILLWGRRERMCTMPARVPRAGCMYSWTWENLLQQISDTLRNAAPLDIPEHYKRPG
jgi:hypothetical protein